MTARYAARIVRGARSGEIIGFAAVAITKTGAMETWFLPDDERCSSLAGEVHMLNQKVAWEVGGSQQRRDRPLPIARKKKK